MAEVFDYIFTVEFFVINKFVAVFAIELLVFGFAWGAAAFDYYADGFGRAGWSVRDIAGDEECFTFADWYIFNDAIFTNADNYVAFDLIEIFFRVGDVKVVSCVWASDHHHEKVVGISKGR